MARIGSPDQILRVNHAGERGAICIYRGQLLVSRLLHPACVAPLQDMLRHEQRHFLTFDQILRARGLRHCYALFFWATGGWILGIGTALLGEKAIWACTTAIESTVNAHLEHQLQFLGPRDAEILAAVESIRIDEQSHEDHARRSGGDARGVYVVLRIAIAGTTSLAIWLSTVL